jgi:hypothetical protein
MNDYHSNPELIYRPGWLATQIREAIEDHPIVILTPGKYYKSEAAVPRLSMFFSSPLVKMYFTFRRPSVKYGYYDRTPFLDSSD